ncbi:hypothetical protein N7508_007899 [Penicillium antarcticum]|uniref:uncharacterized protein n=1 Tax=Penicillium antarcticum TaxID=416450 RepID=UPI00238BFE65|nr:uncharacterized protein N7508_007899 [Penicillium antarcticum]KAJ5297650.1 hypothetical protein N7508_007899 [Penicillium antarcticum]
MIRIWDTRWLFIDAKGLLKKLMPMIEFGTTAASLTLVHQSLKTIFEERPKRLKLKPEQKVAKEEFGLFWIHPFWV